MPESISAIDEQISSEISPQQVAAIADPMRTLGELAGNFSEVEALRTTGQPAVMEFGEPLPEKKFLSRRRVGH